MNIRRGEIVLVNLEPVKGSEQGRIRPCLIVQNDIANEYSSTTIVVPFTSTIPEKDYPTVVIVEPSESGLKETSTALCNQIRTISAKDRVIKAIGMLKPATMKKVDEALKTSLGL
ncbi:PemK-like, MazF-like toxin of type II toxin-antitoxin system [uncultured archaeon]|nr:PemK-like, MazF-like toxin of type II toxin-antitoxin system [uncultured archaeon]